MKQLRQYVGSRILCSFAAMVLTTSLSAQTTNPLPVKNVLLVHGAWADSSSWSKVIPRLMGAGYNVVAVQIPLTSLADDVAATERAIALADGPVLLVGLSYGGAVITEAGNNPKVVGLVFVSAFAPDKEEHPCLLRQQIPRQAGARFGRMQADS